MAVLASLVVSPRLAVLVMPASPSLAGEFLSEVLECPLGAWVMVVLVAWATAVSVAWAMVYLVAWATEAWVMVVMAAMAYRSQVYRL